MNEFSSATLNDVLHMAKDVDKLNFERTELYQLVRELAKRLKTLKSVVDRF